MQTIPLYRYARPDGGTTVSTVKPSVDYTELFRLVADEGYTLTNGEATTACTDTDYPSAWSEIPDTEKPDEAVKKLFDIHGVAYE